MKTIKFYRTTMNNIAIAEYTTVYENDEEKKTIINIAIIDNNKRIEKMNKEIESIKNNPNIKKNVKTRQINKIQFFIEQLKRENAFNRNNF